MEYTIKSLQRLKDLHIKKIEAMELKEELEGWTLISSQIIGYHKEKVAELEKAIFVLTMHHEATKFYV